MPNSDVVPNRFFAARSIRYAWCRSPSNCNTTSTMCSKTFGPAKEPSFVMCPTMNNGMPIDLALAVKAAADSRIWLTEPGTPSRPAMSMV